MVAEESIHLRHISFAEKELIVLYSHWWLTVTLDLEEQAVATLHPLIPMAKTLMVVYSNFGLQYVL